MRSTRPPALTILACLLLGFAGGAPARAEPEPALDVYVISDLNGSYGSTTYRASVRDAVARIVASKPDLVLSTGDMVAGQRAGVDHPAMWAAFHAAVSDPLAEARIPFAVTPGNHDASGYPAYAAEREIYRAQWLRRKSKVRFLSDEDYPFRYSFVAGNALFVSLDDTTVGPLSAEQRAWLDRQLVRGARYPVKVVFGHVPLYPFAKGRERDCLGDLALEELLNARGVSLFLSGHHHAYYPGRRSDLRLVSVACLGSGPRALLGTEERSARSFLRLRIASGRIVSLEAIDLEGRVIPRESLPEQVGTGEQVIVRDDVGEDTDGEDADDTKRAKPDGGRGVR